MTTHAGNLARCGAFGVGKKAHRLAIEKTGTFRERTRAMSPRKNDFVPFAWILGAAVFAGAMAVGALWVPLLLASWCGHLARPLHRRLSHYVGGRSGSAAVLTVACALFVLVPLVVLGLSLVGSTNDLLDQLRGSKGWSDAVNRFLSGTPSTALSDADPRGVMELLRRHGAGAVDAATTLFGAATNFALVLFVFIVCFYAFLVDGQRIYHWVLTYVPVRAAHITRLTSAYFETGRGLLVSFGLTALLQATVLSVGYVLIGVPQPLVLGLITLAASFIPMVGTGLVWVPVSVGLLFVGRTNAGVWSIGIGTVVSLLDNLVRPVLSRFGKLQLPSTVVLIAMLGGASMFGPGGLLLGPLFVRLAFEAMAIGREEREPPVGSVPTPTDAPTQVVTPARQSA